MKKYMILLSGIFLILLIIGIYLYSKIQVYQDYKTGIEAQINLNSSEAETNFQAVGNKPGFLGLYVSDARIKFTENQAYNDAAELWKTKHYPEALAAFNSFLKTYPNSVYYFKSQKALKEIPFEWAQAEEDKENYSEAVRIYEQLILDPNIPNDVVDEAKEARYRVYLTWVDSLRKESKFEESLKRLYVIFGSTLEPGLKKEIELRMIETYKEWGIDNYRQGKFIEAINCFAHILKTWPDSKINSELLQLVPEVYLAWGDSLKEEGKFSEAETTYLALYSWLQTNDQENLPLLEEKFISLYLDWGEKLHNEYKFQEAGEKYGEVLFFHNSQGYTSLFSENAVLDLVTWGENLLDEGNITKAGAAFEQAVNLSNLLRIKNQDLTSRAYLGWGKSHLLDGLFDSAYDHLTYALGITQDSDRKNDILALQQDAILNLSQLSNSLGQKYMTEVLQDFCENGSSDNLAVGIDNEEILMLSMGGLNEKPPIELRATNLGNFHYAVCIEHVPVEIQKCPYSSTGFGEGTNIVIRLRNDYKITVYDTKTNQVVAQDTFFGGSPKSCPVTETFSSPENYYDGPTPDWEIISKWLYALINK